MFNPEQWGAVLKLESSDLMLLPRREDERHEYKSSATKDFELGDKIARAASGFWNSGGGLFVAGVDGSGQPDGGISLVVGRQPRRDWVDQIVSQVSPQAQYAVNCLELSGATLNISPGNAVVMIGFAASEAGPHMAPDNRYYLRAGAHTLPASHFVVEAIHSRRGLVAPNLRHVVRRKPEGGGVLQLGIVCLNDAPALDVHLEVAPLPPWLEKWGGKLPLVVPVISKETPFYLDFHILTLGRQPPLVYEVNLKYTDLAGRPHEIVLAVDVDKQMGPSLGSGNELREIERAINKVAEAITRKK